MKDTGNVYSIRYINKATLKKGIPGLPKNGEWVVIFFWDCRK